MIKYYKLGDIYYWADEQTKIAEGSIEVTQQEFELAINPPAPAQTTFTPLEFLEKFTDAEQLAVVSSTLQNSQVKLWYDKMLAASYVDITDHRTIDGLSTLVVVGLITEARKDEILTV